MSSLSADFSNHISSNFPELFEGRSLLALSGGIDSMVLFNLLLENGIDFVVAHCNFQLRGEESDKDQEFVEAFAKEHNVQVYVKRFDTKSYAKDKGLSIQLAARELRYNWFEELRVKTGSDYLLTAHHADDNLETFLINLSRGSGLKGLMGIPERNGKICRPLLPFLREEIEAYAAQNKLSWREDESNAQNSYLRNRIRYELIPLMKETLPDLSTGFLNTLSHLKEAESVMEDGLKDAWKQIARSRGDLIELSVERIQSLSHSRAYLYGMLSDFGFTQWKDIESLLTAQPGKKVFSSTHRLLKDRELLLLQAIDSLPDAGPVHTIGQDQTSMDVGSGILHFRLKEKEKGSIPVLQGKSRNSILLDADKAKFPLTVRKWQKGDYFYPKGMGGRKKLSKFFKDEKLSVPEKENIWLLCAENEIVWVVGLRSDERFKVTDETESVLRIEWNPK